MNLMRMIRRRKELLRPIRAMRYRLWRATGISGTRFLAPELTKLEEIVARSPFEDRARGDAQRVLIFTFRAWRAHALTDALLGHALRLRGADVHFFTCGGRLPICDIAPHTVAPPMPCDSCAPYTSQLLTMFGFPLLSVRDLVDDADWKEIRARVDACDDASLASFEFDGLPLGTLVRASLQWFLLSGSPPFDEETIMSFRRFLISGAVAARAAARLLDRVQPDVLYLINGLFFAERVTIELAKQRGIRFITHEGGFLPNSFVYTHEGFAPYFPLDEPWEERADTPLTDAQNAQLDAYLAERSAGKRDVAPLYPTLEADRAAIASALQLDLSKPIVTMFTNIDWDTATFAGKSAFNSMAEWIETTIRYFAGREEQLVIRAHPAEVRLPFLAPRVSALEMVRNAFPSLPPNVRIVEPASPLSSYTLMDLSRAGLVYTSTVGMEMALRGGTVITGGRGYYVNRGFTFDAQSPDDYIALLDRIGELAMTPEQLERARRYAYLFFFQHHIPFPLLSQRGNEMTFNFESLDALAPGRDRAIDILCDAILHGRPFLYELTRP